MADDYYEVLGVAKDATSQDIKRAFRQIARECHPDVAGGDQAAESRFKQARLAYETLMDPVQRGRYDRRGQRRKMGGSFFDAFYRATGGSDPKEKQSTNVSFASKASGGAPRGTRTGRSNPGNAVGLDDLFNDFGFSGRSKPEPAHTPKGRTAPIAGEDVHVELEVPATTAQVGGSVTAVYYRMQREDNWRPGSDGHGLVRVQDIADVRVIPNTRDGQVLRERGLGNAGAHGGPYGDLVATVRVVAEAPSRPKPPPAARTEPRASPPPPKATGAATPQNPLILDVRFVEAILGGRVALETAQGTVHVSITPGTSGGKKLRLRGKGPGGSDLYVQTRIVVPRTLDDESRELFEQFAALNPD